MHPNPSTSVFNFHFDRVKKEKAFLKIFDSRGATVLDLEITENNSDFAWDAKNLPKGIYFATMVTDKRKCRQKKLF